MKEIFVSLTILLTMFLGYCDSDEIDSICITCNTVNYWTEGEGENEKCYIGGDICLPSHGIGLYYVFYKLKGDNTYTQQLLFNSMIICETGCTGLTFMKNVDCRDFVEYYFKWEDDYGHYEYWCGISSTPSRIYRDL